VIGNVNFSMSEARQTAILHDPRVAAATAARYGQATVGDISTEVLAYDPAGDAPPEMLQGRAPTHADEIAPGEKLLRELHAQLGDKVKLSVADSEFAPPSGRTTDRELTVVGVSLPPVLGESEFGQVAVVPLAAIRSAGGVTAPQLVLTRLRGRDASATARTLVRDYTPEILLDNTPSRMVNLHRVRSLPLLGALLAALFGTVLVAYALAVGVRRRTRQLGVLRALGMNARRVGRVLVWQGVALSLAIALIGLPLGVALGTVVWRTFAHSLGVATGATFPAVLWLLVPAALVVGVLGAVVPAYRARRQHVSELLRAE
jgi:putative ABC transport system permease protein